MLVFALFWKKKKCPSQALYIIFLVLNWQDKNLTSLSCIISNPSGFVMGQYKFLSCVIHKFCLVWNKKKENVSKQKNKKQLRKICYLILQAFVAELVEFLPQNKRARVQISLQSNFSLVSENLKKNMIAVGFEPRPPYSKSSTLLTKPPVLLKIYCQIYPTWTSSLLG